MKWLSLLAVPALALTFAAAPTPYVADGFAAGSPSGGKIKCRKGLVPDRRGKKCIKPTKSSGLSDKQIITGARDLAYQGEYAEALRVLDLAENQNDPRVLNYRGFATRKSGDVEAGMKFYKAALRIDPSYTLVREYMGEGFLALGQVDEAEGQLAEIERLCGGQDCREYSLLSSAIKTHKLLNPTQ